jgi:N-acetyl-anhydromuramyl-L-alanine amidase AmpD
MHPSAAQKKSLLKLVVYLMKTYDIPAERVLGHGETKGTDCPGKNLSVAEVRAQAAQMVADGVNPFKDDLASNINWLTKVW